MQRNREDGEAAASERSIKTHPRRKSMPPTSPTEHPSTNRSSRPKTGVAPRQPSSSSRELSGQSVKDSQEDSLKRRPARAGRQTRTQQLTETLENIAKTNTRRATHSRTAQNDTTFRKHGQDSRSVDPQVIDDGELGIGGSLPDSTNDSTKIATSQTPVIPIVIVSIAAVFLAAVLITVVLRKKYRRKRAVREQFEASNKPASLYQISPGQLKPTSTRHVERFSTSSDSPELPPLAHLKSVRWTAISSSTISSAESTATCSSQEMSCPSEYDDYVTLERTNHRADWSDTVMSTISL